MKKHSWGNSPDTSFLFPSSIRPKDGLPPSPFSLARVRATGWSFIKTRGFATARAVDRFFSSLSQPLLFALAMIGVLIVAVLDYGTPPSMSFTIFYLAPVILIAWWSDRRTAIITAGTCALVWLLTELSHAGAPTRAILVSNTILRLIMFTFVALLLAHIRSLQGMLRRNLSARTRELDEETARRLAIECQLAVVSQREQQRIAHDLHDGLGQELGALAFHAKLLANKLTENDRSLASEAERLVSLLNTSIGRTRSLSRLLDPLGSESGGLRAALNTLADDFGEAFKISCTFDAPAELPELPPSAQLHLYRIAQEATHNAVHHGRASIITIQVTLDGGALILEITDNGKGLHPPNASQNASSGMGLRIMRHRATLLGAELNIICEPGSGWRVVCNLPLPRTEQLTLPTANA